MERSPFAYFRRILNPRLAHGIADTTGAWLQLKMSELLCDAMKVLLTETLDAPPYQPWSGVLKSNSRR